MSNLDHRVFVYLVCLSSLVIFGCGDAATSSTLTLDARVGTAVRESPRAALARNANAGITNLHAQKDLNKGIVTIQFDFESPGCPGCRFLVRLFDKNGNYLTHITSEQHFELFGWRHVMDSAKKPVSLSYPVNLRDLKEVTKMEFGILPN